MSDFKNWANNFFKRDDIILDLDKNDWDSIFEKLVNNAPVPDYNGEIVDLLIKANIDFTPYMTKVPAYSFYKSNELKTADLRNCSFLGSRCFRLSNIKKLYLSKNHLKDIDVGIISGVKHDITIVWDGDYNEWVKLRRNSNCWYNFANKIIINCNDGDYIEDNTLK